MDAILSTTERKKFALPGKGDKTRKINNQCLSDTSSSTYPHKDQNIMDRHQNCISLQTKFAAEVKQFTEFIVHRGSVVTIRFTILFLKVLYGSVHSSVNKSCQLTANYISNYCMQKKYFASFRLI